MTEPKTQTERAKVPQMDWIQVRLNGGPPCFAVGIDGNPMRCCGRAERWEGHGSDHEFVTLEQFVEAAIFEVINGPKYLNEDWLFKVGFINKVLSELKKHGGE